MRSLLVPFYLLVSMTLFAQTSETTTVYFEFDKHRLTSSSIEELNIFLEKNKSQSNKIELYGHCDFKGSDNYNDALSIKRAEAVKRYLLNGGISSNNIVITQGHGKRIPLNENVTAEEQQLNRRVEIKIINSKVDEPEVTLKKKLADSTTTAGTNIVLRNINFVGGLPHFLPTSTPMLEELLDAMNSFPNLIIEVQGHICCQPDARDGLNLETAYYTLSSDRAKAVKDYLITKGIAPNRVSSKGFGHSLPLHPYPEKSEAERIANRRVEIKIISK
jgi:outer membrane protein OmpA-like peptidoglycan-associated protein